MKYILHGTPIPLQRPRFCRGRVVDFQKEEKLIDGINIKRQHRTQDLIEGPIFFDVTFFMPMPKHYSERKRDLNRGKFHRSRPDLDNFIKYILDVCNGILYTDDSLIAQISAKKIWSDEGKTEFTLERKNEREEPI